MQPDCDGPPGHLGCQVSLPFSASSTVESFNECMIHLNNDTPHFRFVYGSYMVRMIL